MTEDELRAAVREQLAAAWDLGFDACFDVSGDPIKQDVPNPFRAPPEATS